MVHEHHGGAAERRVPPLLRKILTASISGGITLLIAQLTQQSIIEGVNLSLLVGGIALLVEFLLEFEERLTSLEQGLGDHHNAMRKLVEHEFARVGEATELFRTMERSWLGNGVVGQLIRNASQLGDDLPPIMRSFVEKEIGWTALTLRQLQVGRAVYDGEDQDWLLRLTHSASFSIDAVSTSVDLGYWTTEAGRRYLEAQRAAVRRGVLVRRVFVMDELAPEEVAEILRVAITQAALGLIVRTVSTTELPPWALGANPDYIVFDGAVIYEVGIQEVSGPDGRRPVARTWLERSEATLAKRIQRFEDLWSAARPVPQRLEQTP